MSDFGKSFQFCADCWKSYFLQSKMHGHHHHRGRSVGTVSFLAMLTISCALIIAGMLYCFTEDVTDETKLEVGLIQNKRTALEKSLIQDLSSLPRLASDLKWSVFSVIPAPEPVLSFCKVSIISNFISAGMIPSCTGSNLKNERLKDINATPKQPTGIVFTDSDKISEFISLLLASDQSVLVYDGSRILDGLMNMANSGNRLDAMKSLQSIVSIMGGISMDQKFFLVFAASSAPSIDLLLQVQRIKPVNRLIFLSI